jgi:bifunctional non-homologous end joining protein LigD
MTDVCPN